TSVEQLRGKVLGISALGALTDIIMREALRFHGISEKEVTIIPVGDEGARLSSLQTGRVQAVIISGIQRRTAARLGFREVIDLAKLPIEVSGSSILARRAYLAQNPDTVLKFLKAWIEAGFLFKAKAEFSLGVLKKYVANRDPEVVRAIYDLNKQQLSTKPVPYLRVVKSMMQLLARTRPDLPNANPDGFIEPRFINELDNAGFFEEMSRQYGR
ncbi:MAG TPA: ABC transporter substrate-binding protein, partial [Candidatus Binatus sp.]|nr:ABC transporter substrate-binding protein [Candidatus Binatus sp.]